MSDALPGFWIGVLAVTSVLGGLTIWPLYRRLRPKNQRRLFWLKCVFLLNVVGGLLSLGCIAWAYAQNDLFAFFSVTYLYLVGMLSIAASCGVLLVGGLLSNLGNAESAPRSVD
jgi:hypothetical protein